MNRTNTIKVVAAVLLGLSLSMQLWYEIRVFGHALPTFPYAYRILITVGFAAVLLFFGRLRTANVSVRLLMAADFAYSIADRFGLLGPYGSPGVSWGNWHNFVAYTHVLNGLLPVAAAPFLAVGATIYEAVLVISLASGTYGRIVYLATAALTATYVITMSFTSGFASQFDYAVLLMCTGCLFLAAESGPPVAKPRASNASHIY